MKDIAVVFSGRLSCFESSYLTLAPFLNQKNVDIYISTNGKVPELFKQLYATNIKYINEELYVLPEIDLSGNKYPETNYYNCMSMYFHRYKCGQAMQGMNYQTVINLRTDLVLSKIFSIEKVSSSIFIPSGGDFRGGLNDQIAFGPQTLMKTYLDVYPYIQAYVLDEGVILHPETLLGYHLVKNKISITRFDLEYQLHFERNL